MSVQVGTGTYKLGSRSSLIDGDDLGQCCFEKKLIGRIVHLVVQNANYSAAGLEKHLQCVVQPRKRALVTFDKVWIEDQKSSLIHRTTLCLVFTKVPAI